MGLFLFELLVPLVLLSFKLLDRVFEQVHLLIILSIQVLLDNLVSSLVLLQVPGDSLLEGHGRHVLLFVTLHSLVDFDALKGANLLDVIRQSCIATSDSDHDLLCPNQQLASLGSDHVLALVLRVTFLDFDDREQG